MSSSSTVPNSSAAGMDTSAKLRGARWLSLCVIVLAIQAGAAEPERDGPDRPVISKKHQSISPPGKGSSFAPHKRSGSRVYGAPISGPILRSTAPKKPTLPR